MLTKNQKQAYTAGMISCLVNILLFGIKYYIGIKTGAISMKADAWHTLSDIITSIIFIFGYWLSKKKPDEEHPFGHGRAESITAIIIATLLCVVGIDFLRDSFIKINQTEHIIFNKLSIIIFASTILIKEALAQYSFKIGKQIQSKALIADAWHHRSDAITTIIVVMGTLLIKYIKWIDGAIGLIISVLICLAAYHILKDNINSLLGENPTTHLENSIKQIMKKKTKYAHTMHHCHIHRYGEHTELTCHMKFPTNMKIEQAHSIVTEIEKELEKKMNMNVTIHIEPMDDD